jgi:hypothetical protein
VLIWKKSMRKPKPNNHLPKILKWYIEVMMNARTVSN